MKTSPEKLIFERSLHIDAPPGRIFAAFTGSDKLKEWFTESAHVNPTLHGDYSFWGRNTLWSTGVEQEGMYVTIYEPERKFGFQWEIKGQGTEVIITLNTAGGGTMITLRHEMLTSKPNTLFRHMFTDFWRIALLNLFWYIETGEPMYRLDYTDTRGDVIIDFPLAAPASQIFQAITLPAKMDAWLSHQARVELRIGGCYSFGWTEEVDGQLQPAGPGELLELEQDKRLAYTWSWPGEKSTKVSWDLQPKDKITTIRLCHLGFTARRDSTDYLQGWTAYLCQLRLYLQRGMQWK
ncbi:MAG: hypothetical protein GY835_13905 [bacterium]|nr:hypothetical protein [bacterium]